MSIPPSDDAQWRNDVIAALRALIDRVPEKERTPALRRWQEQDTSPAAIPTPCPQCAKYAQQLREACDTQQDCTTLRAELENLRKQHEQLQRELKAKQDEATLLQDDLRRARAAACADDVPAHWECRLKALPVPVRGLVGRFFALEPVHCFLVQCGQFAQIRQLWEAAAAYVATHGAVTDLSAFMVDLVGLYNKATPHAPLRLLQPQVGARYNYDEHTRIGPDGPTVRTLLLPGLVNPGGKTVQNALVALG